jgi:ATP-binding cassette subfamily B protein
MTKKALVAPSLTRETLEIFLRHSKPQRAAIFGVIALMLAAVGLDVLKPLVGKQLIDLLATNNFAAYGQVLHIVGVIVLITCAGQIVRRTRDWINEKYQAEVKQDLQNTSFQVLHQHSYGFSTKQFVGGLVKKASRYDRAYEELADQIIWGLGQTIAQIIGLGAGIFLLVPAFGVAFAVWLVFFIAFVSWMIRWKLPKDKARVMADTRVTGHLADTLTNFLTIKLFSAFPEEARSMHRVTEDCKQKLLTTRWAGWLLGTGQGVLFTCLEVLFLYISIHSWRSGALSVGSIVAVQAYLAALSGRLWDLGGQLRKISEALADANEMTELVLLTPEIQNAPEAKPLKIGTGEIDFQHVSFAYQDGAGNILRDFSLLVAPHEKVALVGPSGGGKSTITKLLLRLYDVNAGHIRIGGSDIAEVTQESLRRQISLVPQEPILFHRSLLQNIRYGKPKASQKEVIEAAKIAHAHEFISQFPAGYDTLVGERGVKLSGGERQRIAIARAILKDAPILVLDEATSSLDSESEMLIQDALKSLMKKKTVIVIAHRLSTIMQMDRIVVISGGKVIEQGKHAELLKAKQGTYQKLWDIQAGGFAE